MIAIINARNWTDTHRAALAFFLVAIIVRAIVLVFTIETGGDGPARAVWAYSWSTSPHLLEPHIWLPGWVYLTGLATMLLGDPLNSGRILNLILGSLTIPAFYLLIQSVHGRKIATISATILAVFPAHVALSATTLGEIPLIFGVVTGTMFIVFATSTTTRLRPVCLLLCWLCMIIATTARYEAWLLIPVLPAYYFWKSRRLADSAALLVGLSIFPVAWMGVSLFSLGELLPIYGAAIDDGNPAGFSRTGYVLVRRAQSMLGWPLIILSAWGFWLIAKRAWSKALNIDETLLLVLSVLIGLFTIKFAFDRGTMMYTRYCLFAFVLFLPYAALAVVRHFKRPRTLSIIVVVSILGSWGALQLAPSNIYVVDADDPLRTDISALSDWLQASPYQSDAVAMTPIGGWAWYIYLLNPNMTFDGTFPNVSKNYMIVSYCVNDVELQSFITNRQPRILITRSNHRDAIDQARLESFLGYQLTDGNLIYARNKLRVYELADLVQPGLLK